VGQPKKYLAHEYLDIRWNSLKKFVQSSEPIYKELIDAIKGLLLSQKEG